MNTAGSSSLDAAAAKPAAGAALAARHAHLLRYFLIGVTASAIDVLLFLLLFNGVGLSDLASHSISVSSAVVFSFFVNVRHNFKTTDRTALRFLAFCIVCLIGWGVGYGVIVLVGRLLPDAALAANVGKIASLPVVFVVQYVLNSRITFRQQAR